MVNVDVIFFDAGGGHRAAAEALRLVMEEKGGWNVRLVNLQELLDPIDLARKLTRVRMQDLYNLMLKKGWTLGTGQTLRVMQALIRMVHSPSVRLLKQFWGHQRPSLVVSVVPHFNRAILESVQNVWPGTPLVTILTDLADYPPHFWIEEQDQYVICGTKRAVQQAHEIGVRPDRIVRVSGMILHPRFYRLPTTDRGAERERLGLDPDAPTGLVLFGGQGSATMLEIAQRLDAAPIDCQLIFICGHNKKLAAALRRRPSRLRCFVEGFTNEVPAYMLLADFFIGKPGPGSISEALAMRLPVIVERNSWTLPQERYNAEWILEKQVGMVVRGPREIPDAVARLLEPTNLAGYRARAAAIRNRTVFEIPDILQRIVEESSAPARSEPEKSFSKKASISR